MEFLMQAIKKDALLIAIGAAAFGFLYQEISGIKVDVGKLQQYVADQLGDSK